MDIIPAIDIINGKCVRLTRGDYSTSRVYNENPLEVARRFEGAGLKRLHLVDLDGAKAGMVQNWKVLESIASCTKLVIDFSGGISSAQQVAAAFNYGASIIGIGSLAVNNRETFLQWLPAYGADRFLLSVDVFKNEVKTNGWTGSSGVDIFTFLNEYTAHNVSHICCTDISKDGMLQGPSIPLYTTILEKHRDIFLIASGGVSGLKDIDALDAVGCKGVIIGKAIYEGRIDLKDLGKYVN